MQNAAAQPKMQKYPARSGKHKLGSRFIKGRYDKKTDCQLGENEHDDQRKVSRFGASDSGVSGYCRLRDGFLRQVLGGGAGVMGWKNTWQQSF